MLSALAYGLAFPPLSWRPVAWVCLVPFFLALRGVGSGAGLALAWVWTLVVSMTLADALPRSVEHYFLQSKLTSYALSLWVWTFTGCVYYMGFAGVYRVLTRRPGPLLPLLVGAAWASFEFLRGWLLTGSGFFVGNPWVLSGYSQVGWSELAQLASVTGVYGICFLIGAVNCALAELVRAVWLRERRGAGWAGLTAPALLLALAWVYGASELRASAAERATPAVPIAIVQGNVDMGATWRSDYYGRNLDTYLELTHETFRSAGPRIVFWPEGALSFFLEDEPVYLRAIARSLRLGDAELVVGGPSREKRAGEDEHAYFNAVFVVNGAGGIEDRYEKEVLLPFSEYFPLERFDFVRRHFERVRVFRPGRRTAPVETRAGRAGVLVCLEALLPEIAAKRVRDGAEFLVSPSNDSWIEDELWAARMLDLVSLRAVEQRRYLVRASTSGPSAIVDPWGRQLTRSGSFRSETLHGRIRARSDLSIYARLGDAFAFLCLACVAAALVWHRFARARRDGASAADAPSDRTLD